MILVSSRNFGMAMAAIIIAMFAWLAFAPTGAKAEITVNGCTIKVTQVIQDGRDITGNFELTPGTIILSKITGTCDWFSVIGGFAVNTSFIPTETPFNENDPRFREVVGKFIFLLQQEQGEKKIELTRDLTIITPAVIIAEVKKPAPTPTATPPSNIGGACKFTPNGGTYTHGANGVVVEGSCPAAEAARAIQTASGLPVQALWALSGGLWRFYLPQAPAIDGGLIRFPGPLASITAVLG